MLAILVGLLLAGSLVYCVLVRLAATRYLAVKPPPLTSIEPISILKPLHGLDDGLEENLRGFFEQDYPDFEILFATRTADDPALAVVRKLQIEYPAVATQVRVTGEPPYANAKVYSLQLMMADSSNDLLVMSDSDIRVTRSMLRVIAAEFQDPKLGVATCPYRAVPGAGLWSLLEAIGMNTEFLAGLVVARMVEGVRFAVGPTIAARKRVLADIGGFQALSEYLAEDFVMGQLAADKGHGVSLSSYIVEHRIGSQDLRSNAAHRLRWCRSTRRSRPAGYVGQLFTNPIPIALILVMLAPGWWPALAITLVFRALAALATAKWILADRLTARFWYLVPLQDILSFGFWFAGFFGNVIEWRGREYYLRKDGKFELVRSKR